MKKAIWIDGRLLGDFLQRRRMDQMRQPLNDVYASGLDTAEKAILKGIQAKFRLIERW